MYHVIIAENAPRFIAHGIIRFDTETACRGYNIIGINIKLLPTMTNDKIDIMGNTPNRYTCIIRLKSNKEIHPTIQYDFLLPNATTVVLVLAFRSSSYSYNSWLRIANTVPRENIRQIGIT
jgi:hypothetical protein